jgi:ferredoxin-fold anticodon binding domain-containing protein
MMNIKLLKGVGISCMVKHVHSNRFYYGSSSTIYGVMIGDERCKVGNERLITDN